MVDLGVARALGSFVATPVLAPPHVYWLRCHVRHHGSFLSLMYQYQVGVSGLAHILHVVVKGPRFLPPHAYGLVLSVSIQRQRGKRVWRKFNLLLKSLNLEKVPVASADPLVART